MRKLKVVFIVLALFQVALLSAKGPEFEPVQEGQQLQAPVDSAKLEKSVRYALAQYSWRVIDSAPGEITARFEKSGGAVFAEIKVFFSKQGYRLEYVNSKGLDANVAKKKIHRNYLRWIANLDKTIYMKYIEE